MSGLISAIGWLLPVISILGVVLFIVGLYTPATRPILWKYSGYIVLGILLLLAWSAYIVFEKLFPPRNAGKEEPVIPAVPKALRRALDNQIGAARDEILAADVELAQRRLAAQSFDGERSGDVLKFQSDIAKAQRDPDPESRRAKIVALVERSREQQ